MGYRSEVLLALKPKAQALLSTYIARGGAVAHFFTDEVCDEIDKRSDGDVTYHWDHVKWYETYPEIAAVTDFMARLDDEDLEEEYKFVRIGEDDDDNETHGCGFEVGITRAISWWE